MQYVLIYFVDGERHRSLNTYSKPEAQALLLTFRTHGFNAWIEPVSLEGLNQ